MAREDLRRRSNIRDAEREGKTRSLNLFRSRVRKMEQFCSQKNPLIADHCSFWLTNLLKLFKPQHDDGRYESALLVGDKKFNKSNRKSEFKHETSCLILQIPCASKAPALAKRTFLKGTTPLSYLDGISEMNLVLQNFLK